VRIWPANTREYALVGATVTAKNKRVPLAAGAGMTFVVGALNIVKSMEWISMDYKTL
jgi:hypothetical protein